MALRQRGKNNYWHAYFRRVLALPDGRLKYSMATVNLGTCDLREARALEAELMRKNREARLHQRYLAHAARLDRETANMPGEQVPEYRPVRDHRRKRLKLAEWRNAAMKYRALSDHSAMLFQHFVEHVEGVKYFDEVTPELALRYLTTYYGGEGQGKSFNNRKSTCNTVFKLLLIDAGMQESPFAKIPNRLHASKHQRPFTEDEYRRICRVAPEPWKSACVFAWYTGMREETVFNARWDQIEGDVLTTMPGKTARYGRAVQIPLHPEIMKRLEKLPHINEFVLGLTRAQRHGDEFHRAFGKILDAAGIARDGNDTVNFNCFRDSFITRCDEEGVPRHATRGVAGQKSDKITDLYSHDLVSARRIQQLRTTKLDETP
jgi:integrase